MGKLVNLTLAWTLILAVLLCSLVAGSSTIVVEGVVESTSGGFMYPDGTVQTTAAFSTSCATELGSITSNIGEYNNKILEFIPASAYSEVCIKSGSVEVDQHIGGESTLGGNCEPGDVGWIIEQGERTSATWDTAKMTCLVAGMRLPEIFEFLYSCRNAVALGVEDMTGDWEWASNFATPETASGAIGAAISGLSGCNYSSWGVLGTGDGTHTSHSFRCAK